MNVFPFVVVSAYGHYHMLNGHDHRRAKNAVYVGPRLILIGEFESFAVWILPDCCQLQSRPRLGATAADKCVPAERCPKGDGIKVASPGLVGPLNIYDLAREAGVSYGTVSRALNGRPGVSESTKAHVLATAARLGYSQSPVARGLARHATSSVGMILPDAFDPFSVDFARGVQEIAADAGYGVMTWFAVDARQSIEDALAHFARFRMDGVLVLGGSSERDNQFAERFDGPIVASLRRTANERYSAVWVDHAKGATEMVHHLASTGRRHIAFVSLPLGSDASKERLAGYIRGMTSLGVKPQVVTALGNGYQDGSHATEDLLRTRAGELEAIFYASDVMALGGLHTLNVRGVEVPGEIAVAGFGDIAAAEYAVPSLTTVQLSIEAVGRLAMSSLLAELSGVAGSSSMEMPLHILARASTGSWS